MIVPRSSPVSLSLALLALALSAPTPPARACATFDPTLFVSPYAPDTPLDRFAAGELGVLQPTWARAYLVVAYRNLAGLPLSPEERPGRSRTWRDRVRGRLPASGLEAARDAVAGRQGRPSRRSATRAIPRS